MPYEIEFLGVNEETQDATAICMRWQNSEGCFTIGVYDAGFTVHGEGLTNHLNKYYFSSSNKKAIDFVICSHPHQDHASGLAAILNNFTVKALYMNRPWSHINTLYDRVSDGRITKDSLRKRLKDKYVYISNLETIATSKGIPIYDAFEGSIIANKLTVLSPSKEFYLELLAESEKTPVMESASFVQKAMDYAKNVLNIIKEAWAVEKLRESVTTDPDNETSIVVLGEMEEESFILTGDVGIRGLQKAIDYSASIFIPIIDNVTVYEIPHHGGRHNISPTILNQMIGNIVEEGVTVKKSAYVCSSKNSDHPLQMVINAFKRRGIEVYCSKGMTIRHKMGMSEREGWSKVTGMPFKTDVEDWD